jgi:hypothetical protein
VTGQWYVRSDGNKVLFGTSSGRVGRIDARRETVVGQHRFFLKKCGAKQPRAWPRPIALPIRTAQHCGSNRLPIQVQALLR